MSFSSRLSEWCYPLVRPVLFSMDPEAAHHVTMAGARIAARCGVLRGGPIESGPVEVCGLRFPNRVGLAAGLDKAADCVDGMGALGFGFVEVGTLTPRPQPGNDRPRLFRIVQREAIINRMGFNNPGIEEGMRSAAGRRYRGILGVNIGKNFDTPNESAVEDYVKGLRGAWAQADYVAVNLSSPNTKGLRDLQQEESCRALIRVLRGEQARLEQEHQKRVPVFIKVAPDLEPGHIRGLARVFLEEKLDGVIATNTTLSRRHVEGLPNGDQRGGLSGAPLTRHATEVIAQFAAELRGEIPIIGVGGILSAADAVEKLHAGAVLVQLYTGLIFRGPGLVRECVEACAAFGQPASPSPDIQRGRAEPAKASHS